MHQLDVNAAVETYNNARSDGFSEGAAMHITLRGYGVGSDGRVRRLQSPVVIEVVCEHFGLSTSELTSGGNTRLNSKARKLAMWLIYQTRECTRGECAQAVGKKRLDAIYACRAVEGNAALLAEAEDLWARVQQRFGGATVTKISDERAA
jgi:hypothetical protein